MYTTQVWKIVTRSLCLELHLKHIFDFNAKKTNLVEYSLDNFKNGKNFSFNSLYYSHVYDSESGVE